MKDHTENLISKKRKNKISKKKLFATYFDIFEIKKFFSSTENFYNRLNNLLFNILISYLSSNNNSKVFIGLIFVELFSMKVISII